MVNIEKRESKLKKELSSIEEAIREKKKEYALICQTDKVKLDLIVDRNLNINIDLKVCQDDCLKGKAGACEFFDTRDNGSFGVRSSCIYIKTYIYEIHKQMRPYLKDKSPTLNIQYMHLLKQEEALKYLKIQQAYSQTVRKLYTADGENLRDEKFCELEKMVTQQSARMADAWAKFGIAIGLDKSPVGQGAGKKRGKKVSDDSFLDEENWEDD